jgi:DNA-directed RNA polymerase specialized sigma subunit
VRDSLRVWIRNGGYWKASDRNVLLTQEEWIRVRIALFPNTEDRAEDTSRTFRPLEPQHADADEGGTDLLQLLDLLDGMNNLSREALLVPYDDDVSLEDVGRRYNLSRERIRQISNQRFHALRKHFYAEPP